MTESRLHKSLLTPHPVVFLLNHTVHKQIYVVSFELNGNNSTISHHHKKKSKAAEGFYECECVREILIHQQKKQLYKQKAICHETICEY